MSMITTRLVLPLTSGFLSSKSSACRINTCMFIEQAKQAIGMLDYTAACTHCVQLPLLTVWLEMGQFMLLRPSNAALMKH